MSKFNYRAMSLYSDKNGTLYAIPKGLNPHSNADADIDILNILEPLYSDSDVENLIFKTLDQWCTKTVADFNSIGSLEKHFGVKRWSTAVRELKYVDVVWDKNEGYSIMPTSKAPKAGYSFLVEKEIKLGLNPKPGELAAAIRQAIEEATTY